MDKKMKEKSLILVVDDQRDVVKVLDDLLDREGYVVDGAGEGEEAIKMARDKFYNVVLLDLKLPDKHGLEVLILGHSLMIKFLLKDKRHLHLSLFCMQQLYN